MIFSIFPAFATQVNDEDYGQYHNIVNPFEGVLSEPTNETELNVEFTDYYNGTTLTVIDYGNGTLDRITETLVNKTAKLRVVNETASQLVSLLTSEEECTEYKNSTQTVTMEQEVLMGFTYVFAKKRKQLDASIDLWLLKAYAEVKIEVDIEFGLRLPVNITIEYPEQMTVDHNYTFYAIITPIDKPDFNESLCIFKTYVEAKAGVWTPLGWVKYSVKYGPDYDLSQSFETPIGPSMAFPFPPIKVIEIFDTAWYIGFSFLRIFLSVQPAFGSEKVTATANATGDGNVIEGSNIYWSAPEERVSFKVHTSDLDPTTDNATVKISNFRYYFTKFALRFWVDFDFNPWIDWLTGDPQVPIYTLDLSWLIEQFNLYLGVHEGYPDSIDIEIFVKNFGVQIIQVNPPSVNIESTETATFEVFILNTGNVNDTFKLSLQGIPNNWEYNFSKTQFQSKPGNMTKSQLSVKPPESVTQGQFSYNITACSLTAPSHDLEATDFETIAVNISHYLPLKFIFYPLKTKRTLSELFR